MIHLPPFDSWIPIIAIGLFAVIHAGFQLGVSVLTLLSGHSLGRHRSLNRTLALNLAYIAGVVVMTALIMSVVLYAWEFVYFWPAQTVFVALATACALLGAVVLGFYFRRGRGTSLWLPRPLAEYLMQRAKHSKSTVESMVLGATTVIAELPFTLVVMASVGYIMQLFVASDNIPRAIFGYSCVVSVPLGIVTILLAGGHKLSHIQRWREANKIFLQSTSAVGLFAMSLFILVFYLGDLS